MQRLLHWAALLVALFISTISVVSAQFRLDLESGVVSSTNYNDVRIPNTGGTLFNLSTEYTEKSKVFYRVRLGYTFNNRHTVSALYAPLTIRYEGSFNREVTYNNLVYPARQPLTAFYTFNSYRLTYRYDLVARERWRFGLGLTAKIRDANIQLTSESNNQNTNYDNVGFVPLINFYVAYRPTQRLGLLLEGDALGAKQGRAEDIFAGLTYQLSNQIGLKGGYRVLEGGADTETIYNFTWINYASVGILATF